MTSEPPLRSRRCLPSSHGDARPSLTPALLNPPQALSKVAVRALNNRLAGAAAGLSVTIKLQHNPCRPCARPSNPHSVDKPYHRT